MKWTSFEGSSDPAVHDFQDLPGRLYLGDPWYIPPARPQGVGHFDPAQNPFYAYGKSRQFVVYSGRRSAARCSAAINPRMNTEGKRVGTIGYYESEEDPTVAKALLEHALDWLTDQGVNCVYGPMNFSIWSGYRFKTDGFDVMPYLGEPYHKRYYPAQFLAAGFVPAGGWCSSEVDVRAQAEALQQNQDRLARRLPAVRAAGYEIASPGSSGGIRSVLRELYDDIMTCYAGFPGYYPLPWDEFVTLYGNFARMIRRRQALLARRDGCPAGFFVQYWDWAPLLRAYRDRPPWLTALRLRLGAPPRRAILWTLGVRPDALNRQAGLGSALVHEGIRRALEQGATHLVYSLMSDTNRSNAFCARIPARHTTYTLFQLDL